MNDENVNTEEQARKVKNIKEVARVVQEMEKIVKRKTFSILWLAYQQGQIFEKFKVKENDF